MVNVITVASLYSRCLIVKPEMAGLSVVCILINFVK